MSDITSNVRNTLNRRPDVDVLKPTYDASAEDATAVIICGTKSLEPPHSYHGGFRLEKGDTVVVDEEKRETVRILEIEQDGVIVCYEAPYHSKKFEDRKLANTKLASMSWKELNRSDEIQDELESQATDIR